MDIVLCFWCFLLVALALVLFALWAVGVMKGGFVFYPMGFLMIASGMIQGIVATDQMGSFKVATCMMVIGIISVMCAVAKEEKLDEELKRIIRK